MDIINTIKQLKNKLKDKIVIPVHHYQSQDIVLFGDIIGDSYKLSIESSKTNAKYIIFCGVKFMAESAKILAKSYQKVLLPDLLAGCPMANMIDLNLGIKIYEKILNLTNKEVIPIAYMNTYADIKSFCGKYNGSITTSSNASKIIKYFLDKNKTIFFMPDYNLGINVASKLGIEEQYIIKIDKNLNFDLNKDIKNAKLFLYDGFCYVHKKFSISDIHYLRSRYKDIKIIVHPECDKSVVDNSDFSGSTEEIYKIVKNSESGSIWGIGTETTFVNRLADENKDKIIIPLNNSVCLNMIKINLNNLYNCLKSIEDYENGTGELINEIFVTDEYIENSLKSLQNMINIANL